MRTHSLVSGLAAIVGLTLTAPVKAETVPDRLDRLSPSSQWNIDFGEHHCRLSRVFGEGEDMHLIFFEQAAPDTGFGMTLAGPRLRQFRNLIPRLALHPEDGFPQVNNYRGEVEGIGHAAIFTRLSISQPRSDDEVTEEDSTPQLRSLPQIDLSEAAKIERVIYGHGGFAVSFETGDLAGPFQALNACAADFVRAWGLDSERHESFKTMARWRNEEEVARRISRYYTQAALNRGEQAIIRMRVIVETDGSVSDCNLLESTETERIKSYACREMERAVFDPALDADGQPMRSFYATNIIYRIGGQDAHGAGPY